MDFKARRSTDFPKPTPETGLAEWTNKIKAMQRQVDADDEAEQHKLEAEIAASRLARQRRSHGVGGGSRLDIFQNSEYGSALKNESAGNGSTDDSKSAVDRQNNREEAVRKLLGSRGVSSPTRSSYDQRPISPPSQSSFQLQPATKPETAISLAAFMGGRATGPRLNRHAPQQNAHDPTQFEQRPSTRVDVPHPIFGRGGVALPGMVAKGRAVPEVSAAVPVRDGWDRRKSVGSIADSTSFSSTAIVTRETEGDHHTSASKSNDELGSRGTSIPSGISQAQSPYSQPGSALAENSRQASTPRIIDGYHSRERGMSISSTATSVAKNSYSQSGDTSSTPKGLLQTYEKRDIVRSISPSASVYSRGKSPEPLTPTPRPASRPASRSSAYYSSSPNPSIAHEAKATTPPAAKSVSLAAFIGGRATGPRLNQPASQQDAHDPTQFENRDTNSPHPIFGKGGIAMPGMTMKEASSDMFRSEQVRHTAYGAKSISTRFAEQPSSSINTAIQPTARERTISTPASRNTYSPAQGDYTEHNYLRRPASQASLKKAATVLDTPSPPTATRPYTLRQQTTPNSPASSHKLSPVTMPSLARPIQPVPRQSPTGPQIPASKNPSRAFLRPPTDKEPTPSISRLKGRGFVQNMIKTSSQLEANAGEFGASPASEKPRPRTSSVLDRWQPTQSLSSNSSPGPISPKPNALRKTRTMDAFSPPLATAPTLPSAKSETVVAKPVEATKSLKTVTSLPAISQAEPPRPSSRASSKHSEIPAGMPPQNTPGLGSSSTLISYIKPNKTGDNPTSPPTMAAPAGLEGMQAQGEQRSSELALTSGPPLKHPTKGRARKPQKNRDFQQLHHPSISGHTALQERSLPVARGSSIRPAPLIHQAIITPPKALSLVKQAEEARAQTADSQPPLQTAHVSDRWANQAIIGVKPISPIQKVAEERPARPPNGPLGWQALPGLTAHTPAPAANIFNLNQAERPDRSTPTPVSPSRHSRIPSTGNRATVMDVAQTWHDQHAVESASAEPASTRHDYSSDEFPEVPERLADIIPLSRNLPLSVNQAETRRSSYDRFSAVILPSLTEEKTPAPSPAGTLPRTQGQPLVIENPKVANQQHKDFPPNMEEDAILESVQALPPHGSNSVHFKHDDGVLPSVNIAALGKTRIPQYSPELNEITISIDVMRIAGSSAISLSKDLNVFYDTEVLAIVHRFKSKSSGLVDTRVWSWQGLRSQLAEKGSFKLQELCKRYGSNLIATHQFQEPLQLVCLLGGTLAIRQGIRAHWSSDNTAMHSVKTHNGFIFIEEHELNVSNMCSGFSYCLTILDTLYVWHGCGSKQEERDAALQYAQGLAAKGSTVVELLEGESDDDEMFWMMLGDNEYAKAEYWKWRRTASNPNPCIWRVDTDMVLDACQILTFISPRTLQTSVYILDCVWEYFVLIGEDARGKRRDIRLAMYVAQQLSRNVASSRPFNPPVHVLIFPTRIPIDLRMHFRDFDDARLNTKEIPDHMNLLSFSDALQHLQCTSWKKATLKDRSMLPLGIEPSALPLTLGSDTLTMH